MAGTPLENSSTPPGPASPESVRSRRDSMENIDSESIRKRPRLDGGSDSREAMSTDEPSATVVSGNHDVVSAHSPRQFTLEPSSPRPSSKMTINVKSPTRARTSIDPATALPQTSLSHVDTAPLVDYVPVLTTTITDDAAMSGVDLSTAISISSSPLQSPPEIEVAEVEDMDQDPSTSHWRPLGEALRDHGGREVVQLHDTLSLTEVFPKVRRNRDLRDSVEEIMNIIEKGKLGTNFSRFLCLL